MFHLSHSQLELQHVCTCRHLCAGQLEVVVGTAMGLVYVMAAASGESLSGFPVQFGEIQAQVAVADVVGDAVSVSALNC
jgi:hypothetical protein